MRLEQGEGHSVPQARFGRRRQGDFWRRRRRRWRTPRSQALHSMPPMNAASTASSNVPSGTA